MTCAVESRDSRKRWHARALGAPPAIGLALAVTLGAGLPSDDFLALLCGALTAVVCAAMNLFLAFSDLISPLAICPQALRPVANVTPFPSLLYAPGPIAIGAEPPFLWRSTLVLAAWALFTTLCAEIAFRRSQGTSSG
ncbi:MAG: hypothetical protein ABIQ16_17960 [Polyangiaceae bacterium]